MQENISVRITNEDNKRIDKQREITKVRTSLEYMKKAHDEKKEMGINYLRDITDTLKKYGSILWGQGESFGGIPYGSVTVTKDGKDTPLYFRFEEHSGSFTEYPGFYDASDEEGVHFRGVNIEELDGNEFFRCIDIIDKWFMKEVSEQAIQSEIYFEGFVY